MGRMRALQDLRKDRREQRKVAGNVTMTVSEAETSSKLIAEAKGVAKAYGDRLVLQDVSLKLLRGEIGRAQSELQSLMRISYAVFCLKKQNKKQYTYTDVR